MEVLFVFTEGLSLLMPHNHEENVQKMFGISPLTLKCRPLDIQKVCLCVWVIQTLSEYLAISQLNWSMEVQTNIL